MAHKVVSQNEEEGDDPFSGHQHRENNYVKCFVVTFIVLIICLAIGLPIHFSGIIYPTLVPAFIIDNFTADGNYSYDFFVDRRSWNDSRDVCSRRKGELIVFESSFENSKFNNFVESTFRPYVQGLDGNPFNSSGLQIWTGIGTLFDDMKQILVLMNGNPMISLPQPMQDFYTDSARYLTCRMPNPFLEFKLYQFSKSSKLETIHYIFKDFTGQFQSTLQEPGCLNLPFLQDPETLLLPFVCKRKN